MRPLILCTGNLRRQPNKRINCDIVGTTLKVQLEILALIAEEMSLIEDYSNLLRQPSG